MSATIDAHGRPAGYVFQYGPTTAYGSSTPATLVPAAPGVATVTAPVAGLSPLATYHFRVMASNCGGCAAGTAYGADATFTVAGYRNAVFGAAAADPYVLDSGGSHDDYWAYTTGNLFPLLHSSDLVRWTSAGTAMTTIPTWVVQSGDWHPWAPSVVQSAGSCPGTTSTSCYVMFYVGLSARWKSNCVAVATATSPGGPFEDQGPLSNGTLDAEGRPIGCGDAAGYGMIDPSPFRDPDGQAYLYASEDFACPAGSTDCNASTSQLQPTISVIPLAGSYLTAVGPRTPLFAGDPGTWEAAGVAAPTVEGPTVVLHSGTYYLFYSGGSWRSTYGMGYATASSPVGPFTKAPSNPILTAAGSVLGPGGGDAPVVGPHGGTWLVYHARDASNANPRTLRIDPFSWSLVAGGPDAPVIVGPTNAPRPVVP